MTKDEHALVIERINALVTEQLLDWLSGTMWAYLKTDGNDRRTQWLDQMQDGLSAGRKAAEVMTIPGLSSVESDMRASEYETAYSRIAQQVMAKIRGG